MFCGKKVKVRFIRHFDRQRLWVFVGEVEECSESWIRIDGRSIIFSTGQKNPIDLDQERRVLVIPWSNIAHVRILPDNFDLENIETCQEGHRWYIKVKGAPDATLGELGELL